MDLNDYLRVLRRRWRVVLAAVVIGLLGSYVTTPETPDSGPRVTSYTATATLLQAPDSDRPLAYVSLFVTVGDVPVAAAKRIGWTEDPQLLGARVEVVNDPLLNGLTLTVRDSNGKRAALIANTFAEEVIKYFADKDQTEARDQIVSIQKQLDELARRIDEIDRQRTEEDLVLKAQRDALSARYGAAYEQLQVQFQKSGGSSKLDILQRAIAVPVVSDGFSPPASRTGRMILALIASLVLGCALALVLERLDTRLRDRTGVQRAFGIPIIAEIPRIRRSQRARHAIVSLTAPAGEAAEAYRSLRSAVMLRPSNSIDTVSAAGDTEQLGERRTTVDPRVLLVVSSRTGEGKTSCAANLASCLADLGRRVLVLDCDLRQPECHRYLDVPEGPGLSDLLSGQADSDLMAFSRPTVVPGVRLVTGGTEPARSALPTRLAELIGQARDLADVVVIDTAPLLVANDAIDLMPYVDSVIVVARSGRVTQDGAQRTRELLARMRVTVHGVVLVGTQAPGATSLRLLRGSSSSSSSRRGSSESLRSVLHRRAAGSGDPQ